MQTTTTVRRHRYTLSYSAYARSISICDACATSDPGLRHVRVLEGGRELPIRHLGPDAIVMLEPCRHPHHTDGVEMVTLPAIPGRRGAGIRVPRRIEDRDVQPAMGGWMVTCWSEDGIGTAQCDRDGRCEGEAGYVW